MQKLYKAVMFGVLYFVYLDEIRTRLFPWSNDIKTNMWEQRTLIRADIIALVVCALIIIVLDQTERLLKAMKMRRLHRQLNDAVIKINRAGYQPFSIHNREVRRKIKQLRKSS